MKVKIGEHIVEFPDSMTSEDITEVLDATFAKAKDDTTELLLNTMSAIAQVLDKTTQEQAEALKTVVQGIPDMEPFVKSLDKQGQSTEKMVAVVTNRLAQIHPQKIEVPDTSPALEGLSTSLKEMSKKPTKLNITRDSNGLLESVTPVY